jgi:hypothetical protein
MDLIYTSAVLTLIAAAGNDPSCGLPGVSNAGKMRYRDAVIANVCVSFVPDAVYRVVADSRWFTRGRIFQEGYLPRRRLYFAESGVLFICNQAQEHEGFQRSILGSDFSLLEGILNLRALGGRKDGSRGLNEIMQLLEQYTRRELSYENE